MNEFIINLSVSALEIMQNNIVFGMVILFVWACFLTTDFLMWGLISANPHLWLVYAVVTVIASVTGGYIDYIIGEKAGRPILKKFMRGSVEEVDRKIIRIEKVFEKRGSITIFIVAITPLPYRIFAVVAGVVRLPKKEFIFWSVVGRGIRFTAGAYFVYLLSTRREVAELILRYKPLFLLIVTILIIIKIGITMYFNRKKEL